MGLRDLTYEIGPFITLVDGPTFDFLWRERRRLILNHILGADLVAISRADSLGSDRLETVQNILEQHFNKNHVLSLSVTLDRGVEEVIDTIL